MTVVNSLLVAWNHQIAKLSEQHLCIRKQCVKSWQIIRFLFGIADVSEQPSIGEYARKEKGQHCDSACVYKDNVIALMPKRHSVNSAEVSKAEANSRQLGVGSS